MRRGGRGGGRAGGLLRRADSLCGCHSYREEAEPTRLTHFFTLHDQNTKLSLTRPPLLSSLKENIPSTAKNKFQVYPSLALVLFFFGQCGSRREIMLTEAQDTSSQFRRANPRKESPRSEERRMGGCKQVVGQLGVTGKGFPHGVFQLLLWGN